MESQRAQSSDPPNPIAGRNHCRTGTRSSLESLGGSSKGWLSWRPIRPIPSRTGTRSSLESLGGSGKGWLSWRPIRRIFGGTGTRSSLESLVGSRKAWLSWRPIRRIPGGSCRTSDVPSGSWGSTSKSASGSWGSTSESAGGRAFAERSLAARRGAARLCSQICSVGSVAGLTRFFP